MLAIMCRGEGMGVYFIHNVACICNENASPFFGLTLFLFSSQIPIF